MKKITGDQISIQSAAHNAKGVSPMTKPEIASRIAELRALIAKANHDYYDLHQPTVGDRDYDLWEAELLRLEEENPEFKEAASPVRQVAGGVAEGFKKVTHNPPMQSLDKTHAKSELAAFDTFVRTQLSQPAINSQQPTTGFTYVIEPKVDGVSLALKYSNGKLVQAATRGNGTIGDDITANARTIASIPKTLPADAPRELEVRGEAYMTREGFIALNERQAALGLEEFANPRNACAGSLKQLDAKVTAERPLDVVIYNAGGVGCDGFASHSEMIAAFAKWGFPVAPWSRRAKTLEEMFAAIDELQEKRHTFRFEIDGAVIKIDEREFYAPLGATAHGPRWARAYKYAPERAETVVEAITVQVGRTGILTPVAELKPTELAGSTIARATLHNADQIARQDIRIGDHVWLVKAGDVIPAIDSVIVEKRTGNEVPFVMPATCPVCGGAVRREEGEVAVRCVNPACGAQLRRRLEHFASRNALDVKALGGKVADALVEKGLVTDVLDLFALKEDEVVNLDLGDEEGDSERRDKSVASPTAPVTGARHSCLAAKENEPPQQATFFDLLKPVRKFGKNGLNMLKAVDAARDLPLHRWLFAMGIPNVGVTVAKDIAAEHERFSELADSAVLRHVIENDAKKGKEREILPIKVEAAKAVLGFFASDYGRAFAERMKALGINPAAEKKAAAKTTGALAGMGCVLTGSLSRPRSEYAALIEQAGGIVQSAVTSKTRYLIAGANVGATKTEKARTLGTEVIDEARLLELLK